MSKIVLLFYSALAFLLGFVTADGSTFKDEMRFSDIHAAMRKGLDYNTRVDAHELRQLESEAGRGNSNAQYYMGLLRLYGSDVVQQNSSIAMNWFEQSASNGQTQAKLAIGTMLAGSGFGVSQNDSKALEYLLEAAQEGESSAQWMVGRLYYDDRATAKGEPAFHHAAYWFKESAKAGDPRGQFYMGIVHEYGLGGIPVDFKGAAQYYRLSAEQGDTEAKYYLSLLLLQGRGVRKDSTTAAKLLRDCAKDNFAPAMNVLGKLHVLGQGVEIEYHLAVGWLNRAIDAAKASGDDATVSEATVLRDELSNGIRESETNVNDQIEYFDQQNLAQVDR